MPPRLAPAALLAILQPWAEVAKPIHRRMAHLVDAEPGQDVLWIGCGTGRSVLWWAERYQTHIEGVDPDAQAIDRAERAARAAGLFRIATFQVADPTNLPHEAQVFDVTIVQMLQLLGADGAAAIEEAGRVARPMSTVLAVVPSWLSSPSEQDTAMLTAFGIKPYLVVEWKSFFREAGIVELSVEDVSADAEWLSGAWVGLLIRAWRAARWRGVLFVLSREFRALRALALSRVVGISIIKGTRWPHDA